VEPHPSVDELARAVRAGDRVQLARAITLVESRREADRPVARELLARVRALAPSTVRPAVRVGISGVPGVGKSTLIDALGMRLIGEGHRVAVLAVDPSSALSGGSILADKSRMGRLSRAPEAFVRPSPSAATLGGVARRTREAVELVEAAGFDVVLVETVGVGQSETAVAGMVDVFVVLLLPGGGDELQGIKKGILELADVVAVTKADGERVGLAREALRDVAAAGRLAGRALSAVLVSAREEAGLEELWAAVADRHAVLARSGELEERRAEGRERWMWELVEEGLMEALRSSPGVGVLLGETLREVRAGTLAPEEGARKLMEEFVGQGWLVRGEIPRT